MARLRFPKTTWFVAFLGFLFPAAAIPASDVCLMSVEVGSADRKVTWTMLVDGDDLVDTCKIGRKAEVVESSGLSTRSARLDISARKRSLLARRTALICAGMRLIKIAFFMPRPALLSGSRSCMSRKSCEGTAITGGLRL